MLEFYGCILIPQVPQSTPPIKFKLCFWYTRSLFKQKFYKVSDLGMHIGWQLSHQFFK